MSFLKGFDTLLNDILTDYQNQNPDADISVGSMLRMRSACLASALWGAYRYQEYISKQPFPDTADTKNLEHHAWVRGLTRKAGETDADLLARLLARIRRPPAGGNRYDYETWAKSVSIATVKADNPTSAMLSHSGLGSFSASACVDGSFAGTAWSTDVATAGSYLLIDLGSGKGRQFTKVRLYMAAAGSAANYSVQYSSDGVTWSGAATSFIPSGGGWNEVKWQSTGVYRYWRLYLANTPGAGPEVMEMQWHAGTESVSNAYCVPQGQGAGTVDVYVLGNIGNGFPSDTLLADVQSYIDDLRPVAAKTFRALAPTITETSVSMTVIGASADLVQIAADIDALIESLGMGITLYLSQLHTLAINNGADNATISVPAADVVPASTEVLVPGTITVA